VVLKVLAASDFQTVVSERNTTTTYAYLSPIDLPHTVAAAITPLGFIHLHAHKHPTSVVAAVLRDDVPAGCVALTEAHRVNSKVCLGERVTFTVYESNVFTYDGREGVLGNTELRVDRVSRPLVSVLVEARLREDVPDSSSAVTMNALRLSADVKSSLYGTIVSINDLYTMRFGATELVLRISDLRPEDDDAESDFELADDYRGLVDDSTVVLLRQGGNSDVLFLDGINVASTPPPRAVTNVVTIRTYDDELFPVKRRLLRPCISLTSVVQAGKGIYNADSTQDTVSVPVDACTFDRVLLYLEHEARCEEFKFDPLIANDLLAAAIALGISGLQACCEKVLGSFQDRVRRTPIRLAEVLARNKAGHESNNPGTGKRSETLLIMSGMVLDISRWLYEHPGGSSIIPERGLNVDSTVFFEIYHASKQSFLYLKEFYIGELHPDDLPLVPQPPHDAVATDAFREHLGRMTQWRIKPCPINYEVHKSF
jgi:hypothetical protein